MSSTASLKEKAAKGLFWGGLSNSVQQLLGAVFGLITARILNAEDYGLIGMLAIFNGIVTILQESGFTSALANRQEIKHEDYNAVFWFSTLTSVVAYVILFFCAPLIASFYRTPELIPLSRILFLGFVFGGFGVAFNAYLYKSLKVKERGIGDMIAILMSGMIGVIFALNGYAAIGLAVQNVLYIGVSIFFRFYYSSWRPTFHFDFSPLHEMFSFSSKLMLTNFVFQLNNNMLPVIMGRFYNANQLGFYTQGQKWMGMASQVVTGMISYIAQPVFVEAADNRERQRHIFRKMVRFGAFVSLPAMAGLALVAKEFIWIFLGEKWMPSIPYLQLLCIWGSCNYLWVLYIYLLMAYGRSSAYLLGTVLTGIVQLLFIWSVYPLGTYWMVIGFVAVSCLSLLYWHKAAGQLITLSIWQMIKDIVPYLAITGMAVLIAWFAAGFMANRYSSFIVKVLLFVGSYIFFSKLSNSTILNEIIAYMRKK